MRQTSVIQDGRAFRPRGQTPEAMEVAYPKSRSPFLEQVRAAIRVRHYSVRTERAYIDLDRSLQRI
jgi:hypothetical protein